MFVMRELDPELLLDLRLLLLLSIVRQAKGEPPLFLWRRPNMTNRANCRAGADNCLARKELLSMTAHAGLMIREVGDIGKLSPGSPNRRDLVTSITSQALVFCRTVQEG